MRPSRSPVWFDNDSLTDLRRLAARKTAEIMGLILFIMTLAAFLALSSWSVDDPSFSNASGAIARNWLGFFGAAFADFFVQILGFASIAFLVPLTVWGWRLFTRRGLEGERHRVATWLAGTVLIAGGLACLPVSSAWPLPSSLGGVTGDGVRDAFAALLAPRLGGVFDLFLGTLLLIAGGVTFLHASALLAPATAREEEEDEDGFSFAPFGLVAHLYYQARSWLMRARTHFGWEKKTPHAPQATPRVVHAPRASSAPAPQQQENGYKNIQPAEISAFAPLTASMRFVFNAFSPEKMPRTEPVFSADEPQPIVQPAPSAAPLRVRAPVAPISPVSTTTVPVAARAQVQPASHAYEPIKGGYELPPLELLAEPKHNLAALPSAEALEQNARLLEGVLDDFGVRGAIIHVRPGPVVTLYELEPAPGTKSQRVISLADDIARSMSAVSARVAVVPGRNVIGIELPNARRETVFLREMLAARDFTDAKARLSLCLGKTIGGEPVIADLAKMPHLLIAGTTGSGKSVAINTMILSLLYRLTPQQCRLIMIDPKMLELSVYDGIPHLLSPVVTDPKKAVIALKWTVREMEERYRKMAKVGVRNIDGYNARMMQALEKGESFNRSVQTGFDKETGEPIFEQEEIKLESLPYIVVIVDEMADLMMVAGKEIEGAVQRLAQMARAAGLHIVTATQRPSVDVITGTIKANFPTRISFQVTSKIDSRTILGEQGAEQLLGQGDMLYMAGGGRISRVHGPFCSDEEVERVVQHLKDQGQPEYLDTITLDEEAENEAASSDSAVFDKGSFGESEGGDLYDQAVAIVLRDKKASTSYIQRRLQMGYNRAASLMERMEKEGIVSASNHAGKREILLEVSAKNRDDLDD